MKAAQVPGYGSSSSSCMMSAPSAVCERSLGAHISVVL
jgi:hypothetical protein